MNSSLANRPVNISPKAPHPPWSCAASNGSSYLSLTARAFSPMRSQADTKPQTRAAHGSTTEQPDVMPTKPARTPLHTARASQWPTSILFAKRVVSPDMDPARVVVTAVRLTAVQLPWVVPE
ncbi:hypothetical protein V2J09_003220 [Rumex salicifolius]